MANANSLAGLRKLLHREQWRDAFNEVLDRHLAPACAKADVSIEQLPDLIGDHHSSVLWGCVFEDFLARDLDDGRNIVDDYLKRRGWKESVSNKAYMTALRSSVMSLYEISDIVLDESFLARDLVRGGEPVRVRAIIVAHQIGRRRGLNRLAPKMPISWRRASIATVDALILPQRANPDGWDFRERQDIFRHGLAILIVQHGDDVAHHRAPACAARRRRRISRLASSSCFMQRYDEFQVLAQEISAV